MPLLDLLGIRVLLDDALPESIAHDNNNWEAKPDWMTPAELMQIVRREREKMRRELADEFASPQHRHFWESLNGLEAFARWRWFRER